MKFKKPSSKTAKDTAVLVGGAVVGGMVSRGVFGQFHQPKGITAEDQKKDRNMSYVKRAVLIVASGFGYASLDGNDTAEATVKGILAGVAVAQTLDLVQDFASTNSKTVALKTSSNPASKFAARAMGLACPCDQGLGRPRRRNRALRMPISTSEFGPQQSLAAANTLEEQFIAAKMNAA